MIFANLGMVYCVTVSTIVTPSMELKFSLIRFHFFNVICLKSGMKGIPKIFEIYADTFRIVSMEQWDLFH